MWNIDHGLMRRVHRWPAPRWVRLWMLASTRAGDGWLWLALALAILASEENHRIAAVAAGLAAAIVSTLAFLLLKRVFNRQRPCELEAHCWATLTPPDEYSFPSGHTMVAFAVAVPIALFLPYLLWTMLFCVLSIAVSRIVLGMHFLSDVIAGAVLGALLGLASYLVFY